MFRRRTRAPAAGPAGSDLPQAAPERPETAPELPEAAPTVHEDPEETVQEVAAADEPARDDFTQIIPRHDEPVHDEPVHQRSRSMMTWPIRSRSTMTPSTRRQAITDTQPLTAGLPTVPPRTRAMHCTPMHCTLMHCTPMHCTPMTRPTNFTRTPGTTTSWRTRRPNTTTNPATN